MNSFQILDLPIKMKIMSYSLSASSGSCE